MKRVLNFFCVMLVFAMAQVPAVAQDETPIKPYTPKWVPESGYWVAENNPQQPAQYTIYFYTNEHVLIYKESLEGIKIDLNKRKVKMRLKKVLETSLMAWHKHQQAKENEGLVISLLHRK